MAGAGDRWVTVNSFRARGRASGVEVEQTFYQALLIRDELADRWAFHETIEAALSAMGLDPVSEVRALSEL